MEKTNPTPEDFSRMAYCFMQLIKKQRSSATLDEPNEIVVQFPLEDLQRLENEGWSLDYRAGWNPDCYEFRITREPKE